MSSFISKHAKENHLRLVDAKRPLAISVEPDDIRKSKRKDSTSCAFACAAKRSLGAKNAYFFRSTAWLEYDKKIVRYMLPASAQKEIVAFDRSRSFEPGEFRLTAPCKSQTMAAVKSRSEKRPGRHQPGAGKIKRRFVHRTANIRKAPGVAP